MRERIVDERRPDEREDEIDVEANALDHRARDQRDGDPGEHRLEYGEGEVRNGRAVWARARTHADQPGPRATR